MADAIKLVYFKGRGRAEPYRLSFHAAEKKFEDVRITSEQWPGEKPNCPYGQMPYIVYKGKKYGESKALASFVARECGMAGKTSDEALRVDEVYCLYSSLLEASAKVMFEKDAAKKAEGSKKLEEETIPQYLGYFERLLKEGSKGCFLESGLSLADMSLYNITETIVNNHPKALDKFPQVQQCRKNVEANAGVKAYLATRPKTDV